MQKRHWAAASPFMLEDSVSGRGAWTKPATPCFLPLGERPNIRAGAVDSGRKLSSPSNQAGCRPSPPLPQLSQKLRLNTPFLTLEGSPD